MMTLVLMLSYITTELPEYGRYLFKLMFEHLETEVNFELSPVKKKSAMSEFYQRKPIRSKLGPSKAMY